MKKNISLSALASLVFAIALWGSAPVAIRVALRGYAPGQLAFLRFGIASVLLVIYGLCTRLPLPRRVDVPMLALSGAIGITLYNVVLNFGLQTVPAGAASFLIASSPIWTSLLAVTFLGEQMNGLGWAGILLSFVGIGLIARERGHGLHFSPGAVLIGLSAICYAVYLILQKRLLGRYSALEFTCYSFVAGSVLMLPFGHGAWAAMQAAPREATWALFYLGAVPAAIANVAWAFTMSRIPASRVSSFLYLMPLATLIIAWLWLGEIPTLLTWIGGAVALAGVSLVNVWGHVGTREATPTHPDLLTPEVPEES